MRYVWIICLKDLRQRLRDRTALIFDRVSARIILPEVTVLLLFAATLAIVGLLRLRRQFSR